MVMLASLTNDLQLTLGCMYCMCEEAGMGIKTSQTEGMVLSENELLPPVEELEYLVVTSEGIVVVKRQLSVK